MTEDATQEEVCKIFKCSVRSLMRWVERLDDTSSHRNQRIKDLIGKENTILYAVPYQHFTNLIENYLSMLKARLYKVSEEGEGQKHEKLKENITKVISPIPKEKYENIFKGAYKRPEKYVKTTKTKKDDPKNTCSNASN